MNIEPASYVKTLTILFAASLLGVLFFLGASFIIIQQGEGGISPETGQNLFIPAVVVAIICVTASHFLSRNLIQKIDAKAVLKTRLEKYFQASVIRWVVLEIAALLAGVAFLLSGEKWAAFLCLLQMAYYITQYPNKTRIVKDLNLSSEEAAQL